jgi:ornithine--oxo-acid transaminase
MTSPRQQQMISAEALVCAPNYHPIPIVLERGEGVWLYDIEGNKYLDMMSAYSAVSHGHCHPELLEVLHTQSQKLCISSRAFHTATLQPFLKKLTTLTGLDLVLPMNTGAEAVETAIKAARRWGYRVKKIPPNTAEIIVASGNFHGRTSTIISFSSDEEYKADFGPLSPGFVEIPFGDAQALEATITPHTCAFLVEPIQGEAGIILPPEGWLTQVREICTRHNVLLILDEVQSGFCRTGKLFAYEHENVHPDGLILGKALGGGVLPVSAFVATRKILELMTPGSHGSTFGGNPLAAAVALKALEIMQRDTYAKNSADLGAYFLMKLRALKSPLIKEIRGRGLWIALEIDPEKASARGICEALMKHGVLSKETHATVVRLAPPLIIQKAEIDFAVAAIEKVLGGGR